MKFCRTKLVSQYLKMTGPERPTPVPNPHLISRTMTQHFWTTCSGKCSLKEDMTGDVRFLVGFTFDALKTHLRPEVKPLSLY